MKGNNGAVHLHHHSNGSCKNPSRNLKTFSSYSLNAVFCFNENILL